MRGVFRWAPSPWIVPPGSRANVLIDVYVTVVYLTGQHRKYAAQRASECEVPELSTWEAVTRCKVGARIGTHTLIAPGTENGVRPDLPSAFPEMLLRLPQPRKTPIPPPGTRV